MKKHIRFIFFLTLITNTQHVFSTGIPVVDVANIVQQIIQVQHMLNQLTQMKNQLETARRGLQSISGSRGLASLIDSEYDTLVKVKTEEILKKEGIQSASYHGLKGDVADLYDMGNNNTALYLGQSEKSLEQTQKRFTSLSGFVAKVNDSPDQKDILDLQARISAEEVLLQNEHAKLAMLRSQAEARQAMYNQKVRQMAIESAGTLR